MIGMGVAGGRGGVLRKAAVVLGLAMLILGGQARADVTAFNFSVLNQRSAALTAQYWNPILSYASRKSGVELRLKIGKTAPETTELTIRGQAQFAYTNHLFTPERTKLGWKVIAASDEPAMRGIIAVPADSGLRQLRDLAGQRVAFPSPEAFLGYKVPLDALTKQGVAVEAVFSGNQEGAMGQLKLGRVAAAGVNASVMETYAHREGMAYRALWQSEPFPGLAVMVAPGVPAPVVKAVRDALVGMGTDPEGRDILAQGAALLKAEQPVGFKVATDADYRSYLQFYRQAVVSP
jgi:phosphonate transport system substrate-binding protein